MSDKDQTEVIPLVEETARIAVREVSGGKVRVRTITDTVEEIARATLDEENVDVTRVPVNQDVDAVPAVRTDGDVVIVPVLEEVLVVQKRLVLKEELHIRRTRTQTTIEEPVTLRKQRAVVERLSAEGKPLPPEDDR